MIYFKLNKRKAKGRWHKWFAWYPVAVEITPDKDIKKIWLEYVLRCKKCSFCYDGTSCWYNYKEIKNGE